MRLRTAMLALGGLLIACGAGWAQGMERPLVSRHYTAVSVLADQDHTAVAQLADQGPTGVPNLVHRRYTATGRLVHDMKTARQRLVHRKRVDIPLVYMDEYTTFTLVHRRTLIVPLVDEYHTARNKLVDQYPSIYDEW